MEIEYSCKCKDCGKELGIDDDWYAKLCQICIGRRKAIGVDWSEKPEK